MGDPECQTILPKLKTDFFEIIEACVNQKLSSINIELNHDKSLCIVLCSLGYPEKFSNNIEIKNLDNIRLNENEYIFHAGTIKKDLKTFSNGGRVLNFVINSSEFVKSRDRAISIIKEINWKNGFYRKDIGFKVINK